MKRALIPAIALLLFALAPPGHGREPAKPASSNPEAQKHIDRAWSALGEEMRVQELDRAIAELEKAAKLDPENDALLVELAGEYFQRGYQMPGGSGGEIKARNAYFQKGYDTAKKALSIRESAGSHGWLAANLGALKQHESFMAQAAILPEVNEHLDWITANDKGYKYGYVTRFWLGVLSRAPSVILKMLGEDPDEIVADIETAISNHPGYLENYLYKAEFLRSLGKEKEALDLLAKIVEADPKAMPEELAYNRFIQRTARDYWKDWTGKAYPAR